MGEAEALSSNVQEAVDTIYASKMDVGEDIYFEKTEEAVKFVDELDLDKYDKSAHAQIYVGLGDKILENYQHLDETAHYARFWGMIALRAYENGGYSNSERFLEIAEKSEKELGVRTFVKAYELMGQKAPSEKIEKMAKQVINKWGSGGITGDEALAAISEVVDPNEIVQLIGKDIVDSWSGNYDPQCEAREFSNEVKTVAQKLNDKSKLTLATIADIAFIEEEMDIADNFYEISGKNPSTYKERINPKEMAERKLEEGNEYSAEDYFKIAKEGIFGKEIKEVNIRELQKEIYKDKTELATAHTENGFWYWANSVPTGMIIDEENMKDAIEGILIITKENGYKRKNEEITTSSTYLNNGHVGGSIELSIPLSIKINKELVTKFIEKVGGIEYKSFDLANDLSIEFTENTLNPRYYAVNIGYRHGEIIERALENDAEDLSPDFQHFLNEILTITNEKAVKGVKIDPKKMQFQPKIYTWGPQSQLLKEYFEELRDNLYKSNEISPEEIKNGIEKRLFDPQTIREKTEEMFKADEKRESIKFYSSENESKLVDIIAAEAEKSGEEYKKREK